MSDQPNSPDDFLPKWSLPVPPRDSEADDTRLSDDAAPNGDGPAHASHAEPGYLTGDGYGYPGDAAPAGAPETGDSYRSNGGNDLARLDLGEPAPPLLLPLPPPAAEPPPGRQFADDWSPAEQPDTVPGPRSGDAVAGERGRRSAGERQARAADLSRRDTADTSGGLDPGTTKIGIWGPPGSGKTTYLAALRHAVAHAHESCGQWAIFGKDERADQLLADFTHRLVDEQQFPELTAFASSVSVQWNFIGDIAGTRFDPRRFRRRGPMDSKFVLDLIDVTGEAFGYAPTMVPASVVNEALRHIEESQGLIFLFDPITERKRRTAAYYLNQTLTTLAGRIQRQQSKRMVGRYLPHYVAVIVTKFDDSELFQQARRLGMVSDGPDGLPRVADEHAHAFFDALCEGGFWEELDERGYTSASYVRDQLRTYFDPDRVRYYVSSSIGFWRPPGWTPSARRPGAKFDPVDFANIRFTDGVPMIRGPIHPINVLEPLIALQQHARRG